MDPQQTRWNRIYSEQVKVETAYDDWLDAYAEVLEEARGTRIIDLGCGSGNNVKYLREKGFQVVACDYSSAAIELIRKRFPETQNETVSICGTDFPSRTARRGSSSPTFRFIISIGLRPDASSRKSAECSRIGGAFSAE